MPDTSSGGSSSTGTCEEGFAEYRCRGFVAGVYKHPTMESYTFVNLNGEDYYNCLDFGSDPELNTCQFYAGEAFDFDNPQNEAEENFLDLILAECASACETKVFNEEPGYNDDTFPPSVTFSGNVWDRVDIACVFQHNPVGCTGTSCGAECPFIEGAPNQALAPAQVEYAGPCEDAGPEECPAGAWCTNWDPVKWTKHWTSGGQHYTTIDDDFWAALFTDYDIMNCDVGRYTQHDSDPGGPAEWWDWQGLVAGDFFYEIGLRTNDKNTKVRNSALHSWMPLNTDANMWAAMDALEGDNAFQVQVTRAGNLRTINVSVVACASSGC